MSSISPAILLASPLSVYFLPIGKSYVCFANRQSRDRESKQARCFFIARSRLSENKPVNLCRLMKYITKYQP